MPGTTPVYGFPYPEPTDLVADYPALGQQLAEDVETVISGLGSGLNLVSPTSIANTGGTASTSNGTTTFSGVSSLSLNGIFTSTYANYRIILRTVLAASAGNLNARLRASGSDNTSSVYQGIIFYAAANNTYGNQNSDYNINVWYAGNVDTFPAQYAYDITSPQQTAVTMMTSHAAGSRSGASGLAMYTGAFRFDATTSFDGITFYPSTSNMTGNIRVYGYRGA